MLRLALSADFNQVFEIYMHPEVIPYLGYDAMPEHEFGLIYEALVGSGSFFVWEECGTVMGFCRVARHAGRSRHAAYLGTFAVRPSARGSGIARRILDQIILDLQQQDVWRIELSVLEDNARAIAFYQRYGFEIEGLIRCSFRRSHQQHYINEFSMAKLFHPLIAAPGAAHIDRGPPADTADAKAPAND